MRFALQYINDSSGKVQSIQIPLTDWEKLMSKLKKYEQTLNLKTDLKLAYKEVEELKKSNSKKQSLTDFLHEL